MIAIGHMEIKTHPSSFRWMCFAVYPLNCIGGTFECHIIRLVGIRLPLCAICTAHAFVCGDQTSPFDNNTTVFRQRQFSGDIFYVWRGPTFLLLIFPGRKLIVHKDDVAFHLRERCIIANNPFCLSLYYILCILHSKVKCHLDHEMAFYFLADFESFVNPRI